MEEEIQLIAIRNAKIVLLELYLTLKATRKKI